MNKNDEARLEIYDLHADGQGVAKWADGRTVFVAGTFPGDIVWAKILKVEKSYAYAKNMKIIEPSASRVEGSCVCPAAGPCGGCQFQHYDYTAQLKFKEKLVQDAFRRIGQNFEISPIIGMDKPYNYRNKAQFPQALGLYAARSHRIVPVTDCNIMHPACIEVLQVVQKMAIPNLRHLVVRVGQNTGEVMVIFVMSDSSIPPIDDIKADTILVNENSANTNVILGKKFTALKGSGYIHEELGHVRYRISPQAFFQVNSAQAKALYDLVAKQLDGVKRVIDAYCGTGSIALYTANQVEEIVGIESVAEAVKDAEYNAQLNDIKNARFLCGQVEDLVPKLLKDKKYDVLILDPPRKGCDGKLVDTIIESGINKIVYVSCNPITLVRDVRLLCEGGYRLSYVQPVDMFPMTRHVECVVVLEQLRASGTMNAYPQHYPKT